MSSIRSLTLEVGDHAAAGTFYAEAFGLHDRLQLVGSDSQTSGFRGFTISLVVAQPADVDTLVDSALGAGAETLKPVAKSFWGYGGVIQAPDGTIWKVATASKKNTAPPARKIDEVVLLLGATDIAASRRVYVDHGFRVAKSYGRRYVQFEAPPDRVKLALYDRRALAKDAGVPAEGSGSHRIVIGSELSAFSDPDGFRWEAA